jgi:hypothetical protein
VSSNCRATRLGDFSTIGRLFTLDIFLKFVIWKLQKKHKLSRLLFFHGRSYELSLIKQLVGRLFTNSSWSLWLAVN